MSIESNKNENTILNTRVDSMEKVEEIQDDALESVVGGLEIPSIPNDKEKSSRIQLGAKISKMTKNN